ncbi:hypothetical protein IPN35_00095 [Candidatus Peregrinibacteria bacterium]|nr:MAG: hypothetical protein IPN35_00095 [Candidatus Peregrinibacteria bacterium]
MKRFLVISLVSLSLILTGCAQNASNTNQNIDQPVVNQADDLHQSDVNVNTRETDINQNINVPVSNNTPQITSATFDGNGVVIQGKNLSGTYVAFVHPASPTGETLCREIITPSCVLQKTVSTDTTIKFISNWIGGEGLYQIYVENPTTGKSNEVSFQIP